MKRRAALLLLLIAGAARPAGTASAASVAGVAAAGVPGGPAIAINVVLEPDAVMQEAARELNARLRAADPSGFALDGGHAVHVTVLQCFVRRADLAAVAAAVARVAGAAGVAGLELEATAPYAMPFGGRALLALGVARVPALVRFQAALAGALQPFVLADADAAAFAAEPGGAPVGAATVDYVRGFLARSAGAHYRPHVTVGVGPPAAAAALAAAEHAPFRFHVAAVAIYQLGDFGTARRRLWPP